MPEDQPRCRITESPARKYELLIGETQDMWVQREWVLTPTEIANLPAGLPTTGWYYWEVAPGITRPENVTHRANVPSSRYNSYHGWEIVARKRALWELMGPVTVPHQAIG